MASHPGWCGKKLPESYLPVGDLNDLRPVCHASSRGPGAIGGSQYFQSTQKEDESDAFGKH